MIMAIWTVLTLPFRMIGWTIDLVARLVGLTLGFVLMMLGTAIWAASVPILGIPVLAVGMLVTFRALA